MLTALKLSKRVKAARFVYHALARLQPTVGGLAFGRGNAKARTGTKLSNYRKTFREQTPRMTPNRLCLLHNSITNIVKNEETFVIFCIFEYARQKRFFSQIILFFEFRKIGSTG